MAAPATGTIRNIRGGWRLAAACLIGLVAGCSAADDGGAGAAGAGGADGPVVLAASSMQDALEDVAEAWAGEGHGAPVLSFAASSALARQAAGGAPADLVVTADAEWMDWLDGQGLIDAASRRDIAGNALAMVAPQGDAGRYAPGMDPAAILAASAGRVALAEPASVPAGRYARAALERLGLWDEAEARLVPAENVRAALALVERGEASLGIVYATDAAASAGVTMVALLDPALHPPIVYPAARLAASRHPDADALLQFLASGQGQAILARHGFTPAP